MGRLEKIILVALVAVPAIAIAASAAYWASAAQEVSVGFYFDPEHTTSTYSVDIISMLLPIIGPALSIISSVLAVAAVFSKQRKTATALLLAGIIVAIVAAITSILVGARDMDLGRFFTYLERGGQLFLPSIYAGGALLVNIVALIGSVLKDLDIRK